MIRPTQGFFDVYDELENPGSSVAVSVSVVRVFFGVVADPQSYLNIFYLLLAFPLGIAYFVFLVTGISVGTGLIII